MARVLRLFPADGADFAQPVRWCRLDDSMSGASLGTMLGEPSQGLSLLSALPAADQIEVYLPAGWCTQVDIARPPGSERELRRLLPFALEDAVLGDTDHLHLASDEYEGRCRVLAVHKSVMQRLRAALAVVDRRADAVFGQASLLGDGPVVWRQAGGWLLHDSNGSLWLDAVRDGEPATLGAWLMAHDGTPVGVWADEGLESPAGTPLSVNPVMASRHARAINLLQGEFALQRTWNIDLRPWRPVLWTGAGAALLALMLMVVQVAQLRAEAQSLRRGMVAAFQATFPGVPVVDAPAQLAQRRQASLGGGDALAALAAIAPALSNQVGARLVSLRYAGGVWLVDVSVDAAGADALSLAWTGRLKARTPLGGQTIRFEVAQ